MNISYNELRQNSKLTINKASRTHEARKAVLLSYKDYECLTETVYFLQNPVMAKRLLEAVDDIKNGKVVEHELIELLSQ